LLPPGTETPSHASSLPAPLSGALPVGLPNIAGQAEQLALNVFSTFQAAHPKAKVKVSDNLSKTGVYTLTLTATDGKGHSFTETIIENKSGVTVTMSLVDGQHSEYVAAAQSVTGAMNAVLTDAVFDNGHFTSNLSEVQFNGHLTTRQW
jgi:nitrogen regulatory protein PII